MYGHDGHFTIIRNFFYTISFTRTIVHTAVKTIKIWTANSYGWTAKSFEKKWDADDGWHNHYAGHAGYIR